MWSKGRGEYMGTLISEQFLGNKSKIYLNNKL